MPPSGAVLIDAVNAAYRPMGGLAAQDHAILELANEGTYVVSGCAVTPSGTAGKLDMSAGVVSIDGVLYTVSAVTAFTTSIATLVSGNSITSGKAMWVAVEIDTSAAMNLHAGSVTTIPTPPVKPAITASRVCVAWLYVYYDPAFSSPAAVDALSGASNAGTGTANGNAKIIDARALVGHLTALLAGFAGGQTIKGGTGSAENLTLMSTAHATKGKVVIGSSAFDEANTRLGIGTTSPSYPIDVVYAPQVTSGLAHGAQITETADAASAVSTSGSYRGINLSLSTGSNATGFTGLLAGLQFTVTHNSSTANTNLATMYGVLGQAFLGAAGQTLTPTATNMYGGEFQVAQRSDVNGTVVSGEMTGVHSSVTSQSRGTVALMAGFRAILTHLASTGGGSQSTTPPTTTLEIGYDLGFLFHTAGTIATAIGLRLQGWPSGPTYTNQYGISIEGANSLNWIQGNTQIGNAVAGTRPTTIPGLLTLYQVTIGNAVQTLTSVATNDDPIETVYQARVATTDATVTTLASKSLAASTTTQVEARVVARRTGGSAGTAEDGAGYILAATFQNGVQIGTTTAIATHENVAGYDATIDYSANTFRIRVTGVANTNITWHVTYRVYSVGT